MGKSFYLQHKKWAHNYRDIDTDGDTPSHWHTHILIINLSFKSAVFACLVVIDSNGNVVCKRSAMPSLSAQAEFGCLEGFRRTFSYRFVNYECDLNWGCPITSGRAFKFNPFNLEVRGRFALNWGRLWSHLHVSPSVYSVLSNGHGETLDMRKISLACVVITSTGKAWRHGGVIILCFHMVSYVCGSYPYRHVHS